MENKHTEYPPLGAMYGVANKGLESCSCCDALDGDGNRITFIISPNNAGFTVSVIFHKTDQMYSGYLLPANVFSAIQGMADKMDDSSDMKA